MDYIPTTDRGGSFVNPKHPAWNKPDHKITPWAYASHGDSRRNDDDYGNAIGQWFTGFAEWQWFVTLTLGRAKLSKTFDRPGVGTARSCLRELLVLSRAAAFLCVFELHKSGVPHLHALLAGCPPINGRYAAEHFYGGYGISRWKIYQPGGAAPKYLGKYLAKEAIELYIGLKGPYDMEQFKNFTGGLTKAGTPRFQWDTTLGGTRV